MLICPSCGAHFEARKWPWKGNPGEIYICSTRRRKPGVCASTLALPIADTDALVLSAIVRDALSPKAIEELLSVVDETPDQTAQLTAERDRLKLEIDRLVGSIAAGVPAETIAAGLRQRQNEVARIDAKLRTPRPENPDPERLRAALQGRTETWRAELRAEPRIARLVVRQLIGPVTLQDDADRPTWIPWTAPIKTDGLLDGIWSNWVASPTGVALSGGGRFLDKCWLRQAERPRSRQAIPTSSSRRDRQRRGFPPRHCGGRRPTRDQRTGLGWPRHFHPRRSDVVAPDRSRASVAGTPA